MSRGAKGLVNRHAGEFGVPILLGHVRSVARVDGGDDIANALVLDAVRRRLVVGHKEAQWRVDREGQHIALPEFRNIPAVVEERRRQCGHALDAVRIVCREFQREQGAHGEPADEYRLTLTLQLMKTFLDGGVPVLPVRPLQILQSGAVTGQLRTGDAKTARGEFPDERLHLGGRTGDAVHEQYARVAVFLEDAVAGCHSDQISRSGCAAAPEQAFEQFEAEVDFILRNLQ
jgi:hypothetical protein